jgi:hypothetical protein
MLVPERVQRFWAGVPRAFMERVLRSLFDNYKLADEACQEFEGPERENSRPFWRRALIEGSLRAIAAQFPEQVAADAARHEDKGFWYHTLVICKNDVALTQNTVPDPDTVVRNSCFRCGYASENNQLWLFPYLAPEQMPSDALLYGIIVHGRSANSPGLPGFAQVRFPRPNLAGYYEETVDLFAEFPEVVQEKTTGFPVSSSEEMAIEPELLEDDSIAAEGLGG